MASASARAVLSKTRRYSVRRAKGFCIPKRGQPGVPTTGRDKGAVLRTALRTILSTATGRWAMSGGTTLTATATSTGTTTSGMPTTGLLSSANLFGLLRLSLPEEFRSARCVAIHPTFCRCLAGAPTALHIFCYPNLLPPMRPVGKTLVSPSFRPLFAHTAAFAPVLGNSQ